MLIKFLNGSQREIETLSYADLRGAYLRGADLRGADLRGSYLSYADLRGAYLRRADLRGACLFGANFCDADLRDANFCDVNFRDANLCGADLRGAYLDDAYFRDAHLSGSILPSNFRIARLDFGGWSICVQPDKTSIGCQTHPNELWLKADLDWIDTLDSNATVWWQRHGAAVQAVIRDIMQE